MKSKTEKWADEILYPSEKSKGRSRSKEKKQKSTVAAGNPNDPFLPNKPFDAYVNLPTE